MITWCFREHKLQKEHDIAVNKLNEWRRRMESQLQEAMQKLKEFATKQSMSEADKYMAELNALGELIEWFKEEVMRYVFLLHTAFIAECSATCTGGPQSIEKRQRETETET